MCHRPRPSHDDVIKWKHFPRYCPFVRGIHRPPVNSPRKGQWRRALMFSLICTWINSWVNNREAGDLRRNRAHYDVIVMSNTSRTCLMSMNTDPQILAKLKQPPAYHIAILADWTTSCHLHWTYSIFQTHYLVFRWSSLKCRIYCR